MNQWLYPAETIPPSAVVVYRCKITMENETVAGIDYSADERADLFLDGNWISSGPEAGDTRFWYREHTELRIPAGTHMLTARVLMFGKETSMSQISVRHGFWFESAQIKGEWEYQIEQDCVYFKGCEWGVYPQVAAGPERNQEMLEGIGGVWKKCVRAEDARALHPRDIPLMERHAETNFKQVQNGNRTLIIFNDYVRVIPEYIFTGNGTVKTCWGECLFDDKKDKGNRAEWQGKKMDGRGSEFQVRGKVRYVDHWYRSGRYLELTVEGDVQIEKMSFTAVGYPCRREWSASASDAKIGKVLELAWNTLRNCSYETFMDCPFYEQMQYTSDCRIEMLTTFVTMRDSALVRKMLFDLERSGKELGVTLSRWPARERQMIPSFSAIWVLMLLDYANWRGFDDIREFLPQARKNVEFFQQHCGADGLPEFPAEVSLDDWMTYSGWANWGDWDGKNCAWAFLDWTEKWARGVPSGDCGNDCFYELALEALSKLEAMAGNRESSEKYLALAKEAAKQIVKRYEHGAVLLDGTDPENVSEHPQILSVISEFLPDRPISPENALPAGICFSYYYLDAAYRLGDAARFWDRFSKWFALEGLGLKTLPEEFAHPRSDCHAWSSHVLYHWFASVLGIRAENGAKTWTLDPLFVPIDFAEGTLPVPDGGEIHVRWEKQPDGSHRVEYSFPEGCEVRIQGKIAARSGVFTRP